MAQEARGRTLSEASDGTLWITERGEDSYILYAVSLDYVGSYPRKYQAIQDIERKVKER